MDMRFIVEVSVLETGGAQFERNRRGQLARRRRPPERGVKGVNGIGADSDSLRAFGKLFKGSQGRNVSAAAQGAGAFTTVFRLGWRVCEAIFFWAAKIESRYC